MQEQQINQALKDADQRGNQGSPLRFIPLNEAAQKLVEDHLYLAHAYAKKFSYFGRNQAQMAFSGACEGLVRAAQEFEPERGWKFKTYAYWWIENRVRLAINSESQNRMTCSYTDRGRGKARRVGEHLEEYQVTAKDGPDPNRTIDAIAAIEQLKPLMLPLHW